MGYGFSVGQLILATQPAVPRKLSGISELISWQVDLVEGAGAPFSEWVSDRTANYQTGAARPRDQRDSLVFPPPQRNPNLGSKSAGLTLQNRQAWPSAEWISHQPSIEKKHVVCGFCLARESGRLRSSARSSTHETARYLGLGELMVTPLRLLIVVPMLETIAYPQIRQMRLSAVEHLRADLKR
ncbi:MAG: hypothetical protein K9K30_16075, partial [Burkholderiaceae bacterium]|nr:hypothetical protein [Burkholderiaceae bacterium]